MKRACIATLFGGALLCAPQAQAAPGDATRLEYARSARAVNCPDRDALKDAVSKRLGYDPFFHAARQTIVVSITDADDGLRAQMNLVDEKGMIVGSRELRERTEHCDELVASLALAISIALDPRAALGEEPEARAEVAPKHDGAKDVQLNTAESEPPTTVPGPPVKDPAPRTGSAVAESHPLPIKVRATAFVGSGIAPSLAWGGRVGADARWDWLQVVAEFVYQLPASHAASGGGSAEAWFYGSTVAPCFTRGGFAGCATLNIGALQSRGHDVPNPSQESSMYAALGVRLEYSPLLVGRLRLLANADASKSLTPVTLRLRGEDVWTTPFVAVAMGVGLAAQFP